MNINDSMKMTNKHLLLKMLTIINYQWIENQNNKIPVRCENVQTISTKDMELKEPSFINCRQIHPDPMERGMENSQNRLYGPTILFLCIYSKNTDILIQNNIYTLRLIRALYVIAKETIQN